MSPTAQLTALRERVRHLERHECHGVLPFGVAAIDVTLPKGGLALGAVHEIFGSAGDEEDAAAPAGFIASFLARLPATETVLWCLRQPDLYGPGLREYGFDPARLVLVTARRDADLLWAVEEALQPGSGVGAVVGEIGRLPMVAGRRLQLAAERSGITAFLLRRWRNAVEAATERELPSAALTRWRITSLSSQDGVPGLPFIPHPGEGRGPLFRNSQAVRWTPAFAGVRKANSGRKKDIGRPRWRVELLRCRGGLPGNWEVEIDDAAHLVSVSAGLADRPAAPSRPQLAAAAPLRRAG